MIGKFAVLRRLTRTLHLVAPGIALAAALLLSAYPRDAGSMAMAPDTAAQRSDGAESAARRSALEWLRGEQLADGGFGLRIGGAGGRSSAAATADAVYVLGLLGEDATAWKGSSGADALAALAALAPGYAGADAGQTGKVTRAAALAGADPTSFGGLDLVALLWRAYDPASGRFHPEFAFRHTLAVEGMQRAGLPVPATAIDAVTAARRSDGSWGWAFSGQDSDVDSTGRTVYLLAARAGFRCAPYLLPSIAYLRDRQRADGWGGVERSDPANANSTALALQALRAVGVAQPPDAAALLAFQQPDGGFVYMQEAGKQESRLMATLDALAALQPEESPAPGCRMFYLPVRSQDER